MLQTKETLKASGYFGIAIFDNSTKHTSIPSHVLEKHAIAEVLFLIEFAVEKPARKYDQRQFGVCCPR